MKAAALLLAATQLSAAAKSSAPSKKLSATEEQVLLQGVNNMVLSGSEDIFANVRLNTNSLVNKRAVDVEGRSELVHMGTARLERRPDITKQRRAARTHRHQITFAVKQQNLKELEKALYDVSDHRSVNCKLRLIGDVKVLAFIFIVILL